jgi:hypothetical protein
VVFIRPANINQVEALASLVRFIVRSDTSPNVRKPKGRREHPSFGSSFECSDTSLRGKAAKC